MRPWSLVHIITRLELGGAQRATLYEIANSQFGATRHLLYGPGGMLDAEAQALPGVQCIPVPDLVRELNPRRDLRALWHITRILRHLRGVGGRLLVHTHSSKAGIIGRVAARLAGAEVVVHSIHGFGHTHHGSALTRRVLTVAEQIAGRLTDGFTADSAANFRQGRREGLLGRAQLQVAYCGIDVSDYAPADRGAARTALGLPPDNPVVLSICCLKPQKAPESIVAVARIVLAQHPQTTFLIAGDGECRPTVEAAIRAAGLAQRVQILGWRHDIPQLLQAASIFLLTSLWEGLPQTFFQAMATALPIVATRVDGAPEAVVHGQTGYLFAPTDHPGLARAVSQILTDPHLAARLGQAGLAKVPQFSAATMLQNVEHLYATLTTPR